MLETAIPGSREGAGRNEAMRDAESFFWQKEFQSSWGILGRTGAMTSSPSMERTIVITASKVVHFYHRVLSFGSKMPQERLAGGMRELIGCFVTGQCARTGYCWALSRKVNAQPTCATFKLHPCTTRRAIFNSLVVFFPNASNQQALIFGTPSSLQEQLTTWIYIATSLVFLVLYF